MKLPALRSQKYVVKPDDVHWIKPTPRCFFYWNSHVLNPCLAAIYGCNVFLFHIDHCTYDPKALKSTRAWIEVDNIPGLTEGDTVLNPDDPVEHLGEFNVDDCRVWFVAAFRLDYYNLLLV